MSLKSRSRAKKSCQFLMAPVIALTTSMPAWAQFEDDDFPPPPLETGELTNPGRAAPGVNDSALGKSGVPSGPIGGPSASRTGSAPAKPADKKAQMAQAAIEDITNTNFPDTIESFDFPNAEITDIVKAISELTGKNFIVDPGVRGKITVIAPSKITVAEAYKAFLSALAINGFAVVPSGKFLKIRSARNAQRDGIETYSGNYYPNADQMITRIVHLKHISAEMVNRDLRILTSKDGELSPYTATNSLIISDYGSNIERIMKILNQLDVPGFEDQLEVVPIRFAKSKDIAELVMKIVNKGDSKSSTTGGFSAGVPRFSQPMSSSPQNKGSAYFMVFPDDRTNSLIVVGNVAGIARVRKLVAQLDFRIRAEDSGGVHVYYLKYGDAEKIAQTLTGIAKDASPKPTSGGAGPGMPPQITSQGVQTPQEIFGGDVKITADKGTNSLVVVASKQDYEVVLGLLGKLDIPSDQVYVEAIIMEMSSKDALNWQVGFYQYADNGDGTTSGLHSGFGGFSQADLTSMMSPTGGTGAILGFGSGNALTLNPISSGSSTTAAASGIKIPSLISFVNFLKTNAHGNVLSTPQILALNNQESIIEVGDKVITSTTQSTGTTGVTIKTPNLEDAKIKLKIKPFISPASNSIRMEVENSIAQLSAAPVPQNFAGDVQPLATRLIKTNIVVPNGDTAVLGGLMKDSESETVQKVPLLGDIPIIGWLFKSRTTSKDKTNLVVFLTPKIIRSPTDAKDILNKKVDQRLGFIKDMGGRDPYGYKIDEIQGVRAAAPVNGDKNTEQK